MPPHQMGTATGALNFFRSLGGALIVAAFGAIVIGSLPAGMAAHVTIENLARHVHRRRPRYRLGVPLGLHRRDGGILVSVISLSVMEERPLRGSVRPEAGAAE